MIVVTLVEHYFHMPQVFGMPHEAVLQLLLTVDSIYSNAADNIILAERRFHAYICRREVKLWPGYKIIHLGPLQGQISHGYAG
jgi:hypothetical protein